MQVGIKQFDEQDRSGKIGLRDGGKTILSCAGCTRPIAECWITLPNLSASFEVRARCCYCGDHSFWKTIRGGFHVSGYALNNPENPTDSKMITEIVDVITDDNERTTFLTKRATP